MRSYLNNKRNYTVSDLRRLLADARQQVRRARTDETYNRNLDEVKAIRYALSVVQNGRAPVSGRPPQRASFYLNRISA
jgi:hypothetical protein